MTDLQSCPDCDTYHYSAGCPTCEAKASVNSGVPTVGMVIDLKHLGRWQYDGIQEGVDTFYWQFTKMSGSGLVGTTINISGELTGVFLVQRLQEKAKKYVYNQT